MISYRNNQEIKIGRPIKTINCIIRVFVATLSYTIIMGNLFYDNNICAMKIKINSIEIVYFEETKLFL